MVFQREKEMIANRKKEKIYVSENKRDRDEF
jgi:hypothetical protein